MGNPPFEDVYLLLTTVPNRKSYGNTSILNGRRFHHLLYRSVWRFFLAKNLSLDEAGLDLFLHNVHIIENVLRIKKETTSSRHKQKTSNPRGR